MLSILNRFRSGSKLPPSGIAVKTAPPASVGTCHEVLEDSVSYLDQSATQAWEALDHQVQMTQSALKMLKTVIEVVHQTTGQLNEARDAHQELTTKINSRTSSIRDGLSKLDQSTELEGLSKSMTQSIVEVTEKADAINQIALDARILSFNAAIEAANNQGQGLRTFGVIAEQIRNFAQGCTEAAKDISSQIALSRTNIKKSGELVQLSRAQAESTRQDVNTLFEDLSQMLVSLQKANDSLHGAIEGQNRQLHELGESLQHVIRMVQNHGMVAANTKLVAQVLRMGADLLVRPAAGLPTTDRL